MLNIPCLSLFQVSLTWKELIKLNTKNSKDNLQDKSKEICTKIKLRLISQYSGTLVFKRPFKKHKYTGYFSFLYF